MAEEPVTVMVLGDSLSIGLGLAPGESWPDRLEGMLAAEGMDVRMVNASVSGDTMDDGRNRLGWALAENPQICVVALGGNDGLRMLDTRRMESSLDAIVVELLTRGIRPIIAGMIPPPNFGPEYSKEFASVFRKVAKARGVAFVPFILEGVAGVPELNQQDGIHPTAKGAEVMARTMMPVVQQTIQAIAQ